MGITLQQIRALRRRQIDCIEVGQIPYSIAQRLGLKSTVVFLSSASLAKIKNDHPDITDLELLLISEAIRGDLMVKERVKPYIGICYQHPEEAVRYKLTLKIADGNADTWVRTFHHTQPRQTKSILKRGPVLRYHK
jgi:hypothetical protein